MDLTCEFCGKPAKSMAGLLAHQRRSKTCRKQNPAAANAIQTANKDIVTFISNSARLRLTLSPSRYEYDRWGKRIKVRGVYAVFNEGEFKTRDPDLIEYVRNHRFFVKKGEPRVPHNEEGVVVFETD